MKENNYPASNPEKSKVSLSLVPDDIINTLLSGQNKIIDLLSVRKSPGLNGYISEKEAMLIVRKKTTWFWQKRKSGKLSFKKIGNSIYYAIDDINSLLLK
jgi:hypothetical protein